MLGKSPPPSCALALVPVQGLDHTAPASPTVGVNDKRGETNCSGRDYTLGGLISAQDGGWLSHIWKDFGGVWKGIENEGIHPGPSLRTSPPKTGWKMASG